MMYLSKIAQFDEIFHAISVKSDNDPTRHRVLYVFFLCFFGSGMFIDLNIHIFYFSFFKHEEFLKEQSGFEKITIVCNRMHSAELPFGLEISAENSSICARMFMFIVYSHKSHKFLCLNRFFILQCNLMEDQSTRIIKGILIRQIC